MSTTRKFPGFEAIYEIGDASSKAYRGKVELPLGLPFDDLRLLTRGESSITEPLVIKHAMGGGQPKDVVWTTSFYPFLVSQRVIDILKTKEFIGWSKYPVKVYSRNGELVEGYYGLSIHGRCGPIDYSKSIKVMREFPGGIFPRYKGYYFDPDSWDGSDLFMPSDGTLYMFVVAPVREAFLKAKVSNILFHRADEIEYHPLCKK